MSYQILELMLQHSNAITIIRRIIVYTTNWELYKVAIICPINAINRNGIRICEYLPILSKKIQKYFDLSSQIYWMNSKTKKNPLRVPATYKNKIKWFNYRCTVPTRKKSHLEFKYEPDPQKAIFEKESSIFLSSIPIGHIQGDDLYILWIIINYSYVTNEYNIQLAKYEDREIYRNKSFSLYYYNSDGSPFLSII